MLAKWLLLITVLVCGASVSPAPKNSSLCIGNSLLTWNFIFNVNSKCQGKEENQEKEEKEGKGGKGEKDEKEEKDEKDEKVGNPTHNKLPDLFWVDYNGTVPPCAVFAGVDNGVAVYVGQVLMLKYGLQAVGIYNNSAEVTTTIGSNEVHKINIKVLCSGKQRAESVVTWMPVEKVLSLGDKVEVVQTGVEFGYPLYSGRKSHGNKLHVGKAISYKTHYRFMFPLNGIEKSILEGFELLVFTESIDRKQVTDKIVEEFYRK